MILFLLFPTRFSDFGERGCRNILKEVIENMMDIFVNIIGEDILDRDI